MAPACDAVELPWLLRKVARLTRCLTGWSPGNASTPHVDTNGCASGHDPV